MARLLFCVFLLQTWMLATPVVGQIISSACYYPDGSAAKLDTPCRSGQVSACCGDGFACLENGVCGYTTYAKQRNPGLNSNILFFRASCTDQTWSSPACPKFCIGSQYSMNGGNSMFNCTDTRYCCYGGACTCSSNNVTVFSQGSEPITTIGVAAALSASSSAASTSTLSSLSSSSGSSIVESITKASITTATRNSAVATTATASSSSTSASGGLSTGTKIGLGIGIPIGIIIFALIGFLTYRIHRQARQLEIVRSQVAANSTQPQPTYFGPSELGVKTAHSYANQTTYHGSAYYENMQDSSNPLVHHRPHELHS